MNARARTVIGLGWALAAAAGMSCRTETAGPDAVAGVVDGTVAMVRTITGGRLIEWSAAAGREVAAGEVLGRIDPGRLDNEAEVLALAEREIRIAEERIRVQIPALQARADFLRKQAERLDRLRSEKAVSGGEVEKNRVDLLGAEAALAESSKALAAQAVEREKLAAKRRALDLAKEDLALKSPVAGLITAVRVSAGEILLPGAPAAEILDTSSLFIEVHVEEEELGRLAAGGGAAIRVDGREGESWPGRIFEIGSKAEFSPSFTITEKERRALLYKVKIRVSAQGAPFKLGMPVTVVFDR